MNCEICSDVIEATEKPYVHEGKNYHRTCLLQQFADNTQPKAAVPHQPEPDELEQAYRRGDEIETLRRVAAACGRGADEIQRLRNENATLAIERDSALKRCRELEDIARRRTSPNPAEGAEVHENA